LVVVVGQSVEVPATAVVAVDEVAHYDHMKAVAEDFEIAEEVVVDHTVVADNLEEHNWDDNFAQTKEQELEYVAYGVDDLVAGDGHDAGDVADRVVDHGGHSDCVAAIEVHRTHLDLLVVEGQELEGLYTAADEADHYNQLVDLDHDAHHYKRSAAARMVLTRGAPESRLVHHEGDHRRAAVAGIVEVAHIHTEDAAAAVEVGSVEEGQEVVVEEESCIGLPTLCETVDFGQLAIEEA
jgi:hypothetical protein